jgi:hypothetical protein
MSTPIDIAEIRKVLDPSHSPALYLGPKDKAHLEAVRSVVALRTLDREPALDPDILLDLDTEFELPERYIACITSYVLMYLCDPIECLRRLLLKCDYVLLQENVIRRRGDKDPDRNRFVCSRASRAVYAAAEDAARLDNKRLIQIEFPISYAKYYSNGLGCVSAIWRVHGDSRP